MLFNREQKHFYCHDSFLGLFSNLVYMFLLYCLVFFSLSFVTNTVLFAFAALEIRKFKIGF